MHRKRFFGQVGAAAVSLILGGTSVAEAFSASQQQQPPMSPGGARSAADPRTNTIAYRPLSLNMDTSGVQVPVACWFPVNDNDTTMPPATYSHRISIRRIGELLAGWDWIPNFASRDFDLTPTSKAVKVVAAKPEMQVAQPVAGSSIQPIVVLAHGYLGSRFDLSHLAETLAARGFVCLAPEYPESLAASYDTANLDRSVITEKLISSLLKQEQNEWKTLVPTDAKIKLGIVGHSLGCGTALQTGDDSWTRVLIAGFPRNRDGSPIPGNHLFVASMGDGLFNNPNRQNPLEILAPDYARLDANSIFEANSSSGEQPIPRRSALIYENEDNAAPNHISFLTPSVNQAMIDLLSPLLPVAQAANIPVLDFDRYQKSRDSIPTALKLHPLIVRYLEQEMMPPQK